MTRACQALTCDLTGEIGPHKELLACAFLAMREYGRDFLAALLSARPWRWTP